VKSEIRGTVDPKVRREKLALETLVMLVLRETKEMLESKVKSELEILDLRVIRENWVSLARIIIQNMLSRF
jgi:hypothetical protein